MQFDLVALCAGVQAGEDRALENLYEFVWQVCWYWTLRALNTHTGVIGAEDCIHETYITVTEGIRSDSVRQPTALAGYVRTINQRRIALIVNERVRDRNSVKLDEIEGVSNFGAYHDPEHDFKQAEKREVMHQALAALKLRQREILTRFYLQEQTQGQICREMALNPTQFRLFKSRAKERLGLIGKKILAGRNQNAPVKIAA